VRGRPFKKGRSGNPAGRRVGCRNKTTIAAASLLAREAEALTRKAELALVGEPTAMRLCLEHTVKFVLPAIESAADIAGAMKAVTSALAGGVITPGEAATIRAVVDTFVRAICSWSRPTAPTIRVPRSACTVPGRADTTTYRRDSAADSLQMAERATVDSIRGCGRLIAQGG
jgi:hypothetical protein